MTKLSVVIVTHDHRDAVGAALRAAGRELHDGDELIVVDNGSTDGAVEPVREAAPDATVIETGENLGFAAACNRGPRRRRRSCLLLSQSRRGAAPGFREAIARPLPRAAGGLPGRALVTAEDGGVVNTPRRRRPLHRDRLGRGGG